MDLKAKVTVLGDSGVGKTSLVLRYVKNEFTECYKPTLGSDFMIKKIDLQYPPKDTITLAIWDLAGQEAFTQLHEYYLVGTVTAIICFDLTDIVSFRHLPNWVSEMQKICGEIPFLLVGTKQDLAEERLVMSEDVDSYLSTLGSVDVQYFETSSRTQVNINEVFQYIIDNYIMTRERFEPDFQ